ncbi:MAG: HYR domain-containing protein [Saprospiraceae bacterium]|nr:HYR domain-containing protein [Saprospiraceae bacterium]
MRNIILILILLVASLVNTQKAHAQVVLKADTVEVGCSNSNVFLVPLRVRNFVDIAALQFTFQWNPAHLNYEFITDINPNFVGIGFDTTTLLNQGKFTFGWSQLNSLTLNDDDIVLQVAFSRTGGPATPVTFVNDPTAIVIYNGSFEEVAFTVNPGLVKPLDQAPPSITCPLGVTIPATGPSVVNNIAPISTSDDCGAPTVGWTSSGATISNFPNDPDASGATFNLGLSTVTYTATDIVGNTTTCAFTVNVEFTIGDDLTFLPIVPSATCGQTVAIDITTFNFDTIAAFQFSLGWDPALLEYVSISNFNPALNLSGANFGTMNTSSGQLSLGWDGPFTGLDLPDGAVIFTLNLNVLGTSGLNFTNIPTAPFAFSGASFPPEEIPIVTVNAQVVVNDTEAPTITCPADVTVQAPGSIAVQNIAPLTVDDNCAAPVVGWASTGVTINSDPSDADASGTLFNQGVSTVTYTATDGAGASATCSFNVTVEFGAGSTDLTLVASNTSAACGATFSIDVTTLNFNDIAGLQFSTGWDPALIQYGSVSNFNPALNLDMSVFGTTFVNDGKLSFGWTGPLNGVTLNDGEVIFTINFTLIGSTGGAITFTNDPATIQGFSGVNFPPDEIPVVTFSGQVTLLDNVAPSITCPANVTVDAPTGSLSTTVGNLQPITLTDNCGGTPALTYVQSGATTGSGTGNANGTYSAGTTTVVYTATDGAGNTSTCSFTVTVNADTPVTLQIGSVQLDCQGGASEITTCITTGNFTDIIGLQFGLQWDTAVLELIPPVNNVYPGFTLNQGMFFQYQTAPQGLLLFFGSILTWPDIPSGDTLFCLTFAVDDPNGTTNLTFQAPLEAVNTSFVQVPVSATNGTFSAGGDNTPPDVVCPPNQTVNPIAGNCDVTFDPPMPTATDACGVIDTIIRIPDSNVFQGGITQVTYTASDEAGNSATCSFSITVTDAAAPLVQNCPSNITVNALQGSCNAPGNWTAPSFSDCSAFTVTNNFFPSDQLPPCFPTTIIYEATDAFGQTSTCQFTVLVRDVTPPTITCPADMTVNPLSSCDTTVTFAPPVFSDDCDFDLDFACNPDSGDPFPAGTTTVTCAVIDDCNNISQCTFDITVVDAAPPTITNCPVNITVDTDSNNCGANVNWADPSASDLCDPLVALIPDSLPGSFFGAGVPVTITYTATDDSGNTATCEFTVTVVDNTPPVLSGCPTGPFLVSLPGMDCDTIITWNLPVATDNCTDLTLVSNFNSGHNFPTGDTMVVYIATDPSGNADTCSFRVVVRDNVPPVLSNCPPNQTIDANGSCKVVATWSNPTAIDNCSVPTISSPIESGDEFMVGITQVQIFAEDASRNYDTCTFTITVIGFPPGFDANTLPLNVVSTDCDTLLSWTLPTPTGFCNPVTVTSDPVSPQTFGQGVHTVFFTATDGTATATASFTVTVKEEVDPVMLCPTDTVVVNTAGIVLFGQGFITDFDTIAGCNSIELSFALPQATDNCLPAPEVSQSAGTLSGGAFAIGVHDLTFLATDAAGNTTTCSVTIAVVPLTALTPVADPNPGCEGEEVIISALNIPGAVYTWVKVPGGALPTSGNQHTISSLDAQTAGDYSVSASINGCATPIGTVTVELIEAPEPMNDMFEIDGGAVDTFNVFANDGINPEDFEICEILPEPLHPGLVYLGGGLFAYAEQGGEDISFTYQLCYCGEPGEMATATIRVNDRECDFVPNIITPNGDNLNDWLVIQCLEGRSYPENSLVIYNQWGDRVFESDGYTNDPNDPVSPAWRGTLNGEAGQDLPDGVYFYIFKAGPSEPSKKGFVEIFR